MDEYHQPANNMKGGQSNQSHSPLPFRIPGFKFSIKRERDDDSDGDTDNYDHRVVWGNPRSQKRPRLIKPLPVSSTNSGEIEDEDTQMFLIELDYQVHKSIPANLCPDNMRGQSCRTPDACMKVGFYFACPEYSLSRPCKHEASSPHSPLTQLYNPKYSHPGYKHTITGCEKDNNVDCKKRHDDGRPCRVEVTYWHVRAASAKLRGTGEKCEHHLVKCGHDHAEIRKHVMTARRHMK